MRILQVAHHFLPRHRAGVEVYTDRVSRALMALGHEVAVFTTDDEGRARPGCASRHVQQGLPVFVARHERVARDPRETLGDEREAQAFLSVLEAFKPDVVHFQHLMYVGLEAPRLARAQGTAVLMTLHEYWLLCARGGQFLASDGSICGGPSEDACVGCLGDHRFGRSPLEARAARWGGRLRSLTGWDPLPFLKRMRRPARAKTSLDSGGQHLLEFLRERKRRVTAVGASVQRFLCPSRFLRERFVDAGFPEESLLHWPNGTGPLKVAADRPRAGDEPLRVLFSGSLVPQKGAEVLVRAARGVPEGLLEIRIHGSAMADPAYARHLRREARGTPLTIQAPYGAGGVEAALSWADAVVVPSLWYENAPLVISEAFAAGRPVLASDLGGMAEMVRDGVDGRLFPAGDAEALRAILEQLSSDREAFRGLRAGVEAPRTVAEDARDLMGLYQALLDGKR